MPLATNRLKEFPGQLERDGRAVPVYRVLEVSTAAPNFELRTD